MNSAHHTAGFLPGDVIFFASKSDLP
ncbi:MAG: hypothetical protein QOH93_433, partial [Chloroflexia bacterium]|nr:hypothetical protein [Chloroflexia bacterium]